MMLLLALRIALSSVALGGEFGPPGHYDGDEDDVGLIWKTLPQAADVPVIAGQLTFVSSAPTASWRPAIPSGSAASPATLSALRPARLAAVEAR